MCALVTFARTETVTVFALRITGGFLVFSLLFISAATALQLLENIRRTVVAAPLLGWTSAIFGVSLSFTLNLPVGSCIMIGAAIILKLRQQFLNSNLFATIN